MTGTDDVHGRSPRVRQSGAVAGAMLGTFALLAVALLALYGHWTLRPGRAGHAESETRRLAELGAASLSSRDVPVGAVLLFGDSVIGVGHNVVRRDTSAGGHAEIEAISDALRRVGFERFRQFDRDSLVLVTTFEPCPMCRGAILEYRIRRVEFLKGKPILGRLMEDLRTLRYYWERRQAGRAELQDSLFRLHPDFHETS